VFLDTCDPNSIAGAIAQSGGVAIGTPPLMSPDLELQTWQGRGVLVNQFDSYEAQQPF